MARFDAPGVYKAYYVVASLPIEQISLASSQDVYRTLGGDLLVDGAINSLASFTAAAAVIATSLLF